MSLALKSILLYTLNMYNILFVSLTLLSIYDGVNALQSGNPCYLLWTRQNGTCRSRNSCTTLIGSSFISAECNPGNSKDSELICCPNKESGHIAISKRSLPKIFPSPPNCGKTMYDDLLDDRIVGGEEAGAGRWPWIVMIGTQLSENVISWTCGGTLISSRWIVTAANCYYLSHGALNWTRLGATNLKEITPHTLDMKLELFLLNEKFNDGNLTEDIALAKLEKDVGFTDYIRPICLPLDKEMRYNEYLDENPSTAGWGTVKYNGLPSDALMEVQMDVIDRDTCRKIFGVHNTSIVSTQICAGSLTEEKDACQGDSGGPLTIYNSKHNSYYLIGIVSFGYKCGIGYPSVYTKVSEYVDWIEETVRRNQYT